MMGGGGYFCRKNTYSKCGCIKPRRSLRTQQAILEINRIEHLLQAQWDTRIKNSKTVSSAALHIEGRILAWAEELGNVIKCNILHGIDKGRGRGLVKTLQQITGHIV